MNGSNPCGLFGRSSGAESNAEAAKTAGVLFPLTARRIDMGNTMRIDMGNTFCALRRPATHFLREAELLHTSSQTPSIGPLGACDEVCSSSCGTGEISLQTIEVLPMCVLKVLPMSMRATHPDPLPPGEGTACRPRWKKSLISECPAAHETFSLSSGERAGVRASVLSTELFRLSGFLSSWGQVRQEL